eukprot:362220-Chlamydomonas_euryale.AAC.4
MGACCVMQTVGAGCGLDATGTCCDLDAEGACCGMRGSVACYHAARWNAADDAPVWIACTHTAM